MKHQNFERNNTWTNKILPWWIEPITFRTNKHVDQSNQAYWNVATKRLVDNVCMTMEQDFVVKLLGKVESELFLLTNRYTEVEELFVEVSTPDFRHTHTTYDTAGNIVFGVNIELLSIYFFLLYAKKQTQTKHVLSFKFCFVCLCFFLLFIYFFLMRGWGCVKYDDYFVFV